MAAIDLNQAEEEFIKAKSNWELEKLYIDLASYKGKALTPVEKKFLRGLLCGCSPAEIAAIIYQSRTSSTVRVYLSNGIYKYIEEMLSSQAGYSIKVKSWNRVTQLLEKAGYKKDKSQLQPAHSPINSPQELEANLFKITSTQIQDWGEAIDVSRFYGRITELKKTQEWIVQERCRLVVILGMGGIGKTAFSVKLAQEIQDKFDYVIWRSLRLLPSLDVILEELISILSQQIELKTATIGSKISHFIEYLRSARCLIILDNLDSILESGNGYEQSNYLPMSANNPELNDGVVNYILSGIQYRQGYENYAELIRRVGESQHQSCVMLTSREKTPEIAAIEGKQLPVRSLKLTGLNLEESRLILNAKGLTDIQKSSCEVLLDCYGGNPLFLQLLGTAIQELFDGNIDEFLAQGTLVFGDIRAILDQQFQRLSEIEKYLMYWLSLHQDSISIRQLQKNTNIPRLSPKLAERLILEAVELLNRRSLLERQAANFYQIPALKEYIMGVGSWELGIKT